MLKFIKFLCLSLIFFGPVLSWSACLPTTCINNSDCLVGELCHKDFSSSHMQGNVKVGTECPHKCYSVN